MNTCKDLYLRYKDTCSKANISIPDIKDKLSDKELSSALSNVNLQIHFLTQCINEREYYTGKCIDVEDRDKGHMFWISKLKQERVNLQNTKTKVKKIIKERNIQEEISEPISIGEDSEDVSKEDSEDSEDVSKEDSEDSEDVPNEDSEDSEDVSKEDSEDVTKEDSEDVTNINKKVSEMTVRKRIKKSKKDKKMSNIAIYTNIKAEFNYYSKDGLVKLEFSTKMADYKTIKDLIEYLFGPFRSRKLKSFKTKDWGLGVLITELFPSIPINDFVVLNKKGEILPMSNIIGRESRLYKLNVLVHEIQALGEFDDYIYISNEIFEKAVYFGINDYTILKTILTPLYIKARQKVMEIIRRNPNIDWQKILDRYFQNELQDLEKYITKNKTKWNIRGLLDPERYIQEMTMQFIDD